MSGPLLDVGARRLREEAVWAELESLVDRLARRGERSLSFAEVERLGGLYRDVAAQLARAREHRLDPARTRYLDALVRRAHFVIYAPPKRGLRPLLRLVTGGFAASFRATFPLQLASGALFLLGSLSGYVGTLRHTEIAYPILSMMFPAELVQGLIESPEIREQYITSGQEMGVGFRSAFAAALAANNARVAYVAFALGIALGIPTILVQLVNGAVLGSMAALFDRDRLDVDFWAWILPHGIPEVLALTIAAASGLRLAQALIDPGGRPRREALVSAGRVAARLMGFVTLLLLYAALIEGHFRQFSLGVAPRLGLAAVNLAALVAYLVLAGRGDDQRPSTSSGSR